MSFLEIKNLQKKFYAPDGSLTATITLPELNLDRGQQLLLTGTSGCGKSTVLHLIAGLIKPDQGTIICNTINLTGLSSQARAFWRAQTLGYVFQNFNLLEELTVEENILTAAWLAGRHPTSPLKREAALLLEQVGLADKSRCYPNQLSLGEEQRVAVVRALFNAPDLVLADEPTASLDRANAEIVLKLLKELCASQHTTLLLSSHDEYVKQQIPESYDLSSAGKQAGGPEEALE